VLGVLLLAAPQAARAADPLVWELGGELRSLYTFTRTPDAERVLVEGSARSVDTWLLLTRPRARMQLAYGDHVEGELVYDLELRTGSGLDSLAFRAGDAIGTRTWLDADRVISQHADLDVRHGLYRGWLRYASENVELTLGRQRIPLGRGRLWNPADLFNSIPPLALQGDQRIGKDALLARARLAGELWGSLIWAPEDDPDEQRSAVRLELERPELDIAGFAGHFGRDEVVGLDLARNLGDAALRLELTWSHLARGDRVVQAVASVDRTLALGSGLYVLVEHFYNENTLRPLPLDALPPAPSVEEGLRAFDGFDRGELDRLATQVRNQTGLALGYSLTPLLRADLLWLLDWHGPSLATFPVLSCDVGSGFEIRIGAQLFLGPERRRSEYGDVPNLLFFELGAYF